MSPFLNLLFPIEGLINSVKSLNIDKFNREMFFGEICPFTILMLFQSAF